MVSESTSGKIICWNWLSWVNNLIKTHNSLITYNFFIELPILPIIHGLKKKYRPLFYGLVFQLWMSDRKVCLTTLSFTFMVSFSLNSLIGVHSLTLISIVHPTNPLLYEDLSCIEVHMGILLPRAVMCPQGRCVPQIMSLKLLMFPRNAPIKMVQEWKRKYNKHWKFFFFIYVFIM